MKISIIILQKATDHTCSVVFIFKVDEQKHKSGWSVFVNIYYDKRRKVVCY